MSGNGHKKYVWKSFLHSNRQSVHILTTALYHVVANDGGGGMGYFIKEGAPTENCSRFFPELQRCFWNYSEIRPLLDFPVWWISGCSCKMPCGSERWGSCPARTPPLGCTVSYSAFSWFCLATWAFSGHEMPLDHNAVLRQKRSFLNRSRPSKGQTHISTAPQAASASSVPLTPGDIPGFVGTFP